MPPPTRTSKAAPDKPDVTPTSRPAAKPAAKPTTKPAARKAATRRKKPAPAVEAAPRRRRREGIPALTKRDLVYGIAEQQDIPRFVVESVLNGILDRIQAAMAESQPVEFRDFGVFCCITRKPRLGRNPKRPAETVLIPARRNVIFKPGKQLKQRVRNP